MGKLRVLSGRTILGQLQEERTRCIVTFGQSDYRHGRGNCDEQRQVKLRWLADNGAFAFYYRSHAPFLFAFPSREAFEEMKTRVLLAGIPLCRVECVGDPSPNDKPLREALAGK